MDTLIAFRQEIDSLTDLEYQQCIELIGRKLITSLIFIGLHQQIHQDKINNLSKIMDKLIEFCQEIDSLTDLEYQQCIELIGRKLITSLIFIGLHQQIHQDKKNNNLSKILEIVTQIKESRENEEYTDLPLNNGHNYQLDDIPSVLLSEISSFLTLNDKIRFEQTNRSVLIGVRFYKLPLYPLSAHNFVKLAKY
eukprot:500455_1